MLKVAYISPDGQLSPKQPTQREVFVQEALETLAVTRFRDKQKAMEMFSEEREEIEKIKLEIRELEIKLNLKPNSYV